MFINLLWSVQLLRFASVLMFLTFDQLQKKLVAYPFIVAFQTSVIQT